MRICFRAFVLPSAAVQDAIELYLCRTNLSCFSCQPLLLDRDSLNAAVSAQSESN